MSLTCFTSYYKKKGLPRSKRSFASGFTLVELIVSLGIIVVILSLVLSNQSKYTDGTMLTGLADDISLSLSQAQIYGISVREFSPGSSEFEIAYTSQGDSSSYLYFADRGAVNHVYDSGWNCPTDTSSECISKTSITRGNAIIKLCAIPDSGPDFCDVGRLDVTFLRPLPDASLVFFDLTGAPLSLSSIKGAKIEVGSPSGATRSVSVFASGQISVQ